MLQLSRLDKIILCLVHYLMIRDAPILVFEGIFYWVQGYNEVFLFIFIYRLPKTEEVSNSASICSLTIICRFICLHFGEFLLRGIFSYHLFAFSKFSRLTTVTVALLLMSRLVYRCLPTNLG